MVSVFLLVLAGSAALIVANHEDDKYGPLSSGGFAGTGVQRNIVSDDPDGFGISRLTATGDETAYYYSSLANDGEHAVQVTGIQLDDVTVKAQWAPFPKSDTTEVPEAGAAWRNFPVTLDDEIIQLRYTIRRPPQCGDRPTVPGQGIFYSDVHVVHWESLLGSHTSRVGFDAGLELQLC